MLSGIFIEKHGLSARCLRGWLCIASWRQRGSQCHKHSNCRHTRLLRGTIALVCRHLRSTASTTRDFPYYVSVSATQMLREAGQITQRFPTISVSHLTESSAAARCDAGVSPRDLANGHVDELAQSLITP